MAEETGAAKKKRKIPKTAVIVVGVMLVEAAGFLGAMKMFGTGPSDTYGADGEHYVQGSDPTTQPVTSEVMVLRKTKIPNNKSGRAHIYDMDITVVVASDRKKEMEELVQERSGEIGDRISMIVRSADPRVLEDPEFQSLKMKFREAFAKISGDSSLVLRVLIPRSVKMRAD